MADSGHDQEQDAEMLNYVNNLDIHRGNLKAALDYHSVRDPDLELVSKEGRRLFGHRAVLGIFSQMLAEVFSYIPCCQKSSLMFPDTSSEVLSHLLNVLYTGSTETSSDKVELLCGPVGVFATAKQLGINIKSDQKVIEVVDKHESQAKTPKLPHLRSIHDESLDIADDTEDDNVVVEAETEPETMEITPQIPMFDLSHFLYQGAGGGEEEEKEVGGQVENEDYYVCKLPDCGAVIQFENCGARSKILNHYTSHFQRELEQEYSHLLTAETGCTLCGKELKGAIKSKVWIHIGVTHDKTNEILQKKGIEPIRVNIRMNKRKASEDTSPTMMMDEEKTMMASGVPRLLEYPSYTQTMNHCPPGQVRTNTCKLCGQVTQNRKRLLKHYCTRHYIDRLSLMEFTFMEKNRCVICQKDFVGAKKASKVIHIGLEHKKIFDILDEEFGKDGYLKHDSSTPIAPPPLKKIKMEPQPQYRPIAPKATSPISQTAASMSPEALTVVNPHKMSHHVPRVEASMSERMKEIQDLGNTCYVCGKKFDLFRSMLLPHYCGHFYKEIAQGHEDYFTDTNCKLCGATATKRKSRIIHLGVKHELVLPFINEVLKSRDQIEENKEGEGVADIEEVVEEEEEEPRSDDTQNEFVIDESELKSENEEHYEELNGVVPELKMDFDEPEPKVVTPLRIKTLGLKLATAEDADSGTDVSEDGMMIGGVVKEEKVEQVKALNNKEVWKTKTETLAKIVMNQDNLDNQDKPYHLEQMFTSDTGAVNGVAEDIVEGQEEDEEFFEDEVTPENLGLVCKICAVTETSDHELLTHYCSHFDAELKDISGKMINEDHKCVECHKMLGNNKRRLYHFGVKHLKVIPLINQKLRSVKRSLDDSHEDDFEITYDAEPVNHDQGTPGRNRSLLVGNSHLNSNNKVGANKKQINASLTKSKPGGAIALLTARPVETISSPAPVEKGRAVPALRPITTEYNCPMCDKTTKNQNLLDLHLIAIHFKKELLRKHGNPENKCEICHKVFQNVDAFAFHIGKDHNLLKDIMTDRLESDSNPASTESSPEVNPISIPKIVTNDVKPISKISLEASKNKFSCYKCGASRRGLKELYGHYSLQHFSAELKEEFGVKKQCTFEDCNKNLENITAWISHLGQEHPHVLNKHIPEKYWQHSSENSKNSVSDDGKRMFSCPLKCSSSFDDKLELLGHFKSVHGFSDDIIAKVLRAHPALNVIEGGKKVEA